MGVSIQLPELNSPRKRRPTSRLLRKLLNAVLLAIVLILWFLSGVLWMSFKDEDLGTETQATETADIDLKAAMVGMNNLVIVTCHAIWLGGPTAGENETEW